MISGEIPATSRAVKCGAARNGTGVLQKHADSSRCRRLDGRVGTYMSVPSPARSDSWTNGTPGNTPPDSVSSKT